MPAKKNSKPSATTQNFPIVGIGASAGGLDAFKQFLKAVPEDSGMAYVFVQHLDPSHESILPDILSRVTNIPVNEITDDIHLAPNHVYVIPENKTLTSMDGVLKLTPRNKLKTNLAIDVFFTSLAEVHHSLAIGVVLSGNGSDGTLGLKAIKAYGGITFAQDQKSAANGDMPQHAVDGGAVDFILSPAAIPLEILALLDKSHALGKHDNDESTFQDILVLLRQHSGVDFTYYKQTTIRRRIARRMAISKSANIVAYLKFLQKNKTAPGELFNDLLIPVTTFFRDPKIFQSVAKNVFPELVKNTSAVNSIRIWIAGCSTGEEAYTLAISLHEFLGENLMGTQIQVFASDISEVAIAKARIGFYSKSQLLNVSDAILKKYFTKNHNGYIVNRQIRDLCVFAVHNFLKDPPFAKMNLVACRNVLIYMDSFLQKKALSTFHYALRDNGFLLLGKSETTNPAEELFTPFAKSAKIYSRKYVPGRAARLAINGNDEYPNDASRKILKPEIPKTDFRKSAESVLLSKYTPASVVINAQMDIVHIHGAIASFLEPSPGKPTFNLLKMAREGLAYDLRNTLHKVRETGNPGIKEGIPVKINGKTIDVSIEILPLTDTVEPHFLILFYRTLSYKKEQDVNLSDEEISTDENLKRIRQLEKELAQTHQDVHAITEDQDAFNEELQSANEELMSGSEELQSLNEELETSKEELQSSNEELIIINQELLDKQDIINISKEYTEAIIATLREPIVVLDTDLRIQNINRAFAKKFSITKEEAFGKMIYEIQNHLFDNAFMRTMLEKVLPNKVQIDDYQISVNLLPFGDSTMLLNARQVTNEKSKEQLILLAIEDITERKIIEQRLQEFSDSLEIKVKERTEDLLTSNVELGTSVKELHQANLQLQQFAYVASHDLQEPLRKILMFTSRLEVHHDKLPQDAIELLDKINSSSARMRTLIQDLLEFSYLNNHEGLFISTDLNIIMKNILMDFELLIEQKKVDITFEMLPVVSAIPLQMNQLFYNLISNALKFSSVTISPAINITAHELTQAQIDGYPTLNPSLPYFEIIIKDNGIGFEQKYEQQIFTIFQRLHNNDVYIGTGIGLAISKKIIENHSGEIFAKAKKNKGAAFHIILPLHQLS